MKRFLIFTLTALVLLTTAQLSIMALNNISFGQRNFQMGKYNITQRWAYDADGPLSSSAVTSVFTVPEILDDEGNVIQVSELGWSAYGSARYDGDNLRYKSTYHVKAKILTYKREDKGNVIGDMNVSEWLLINMKPIPEDTEADIDDCEALGKANGQDPSNNDKHATESKIPW